ncbi:MAG: flavohemoglobin expression-modulating QEGLA motif protein [Actinomycetota bacterium]
MRASPTEPPLLGDRDLAADRALADLAGSCRYLLDVNPVDLSDARRSFDRDGRPPELHYRDLEDDPALALRRLADVPLDDVEDPTVASLLRAKARELELQLEMLACRGEASFRALSIELFGAVSPHLLREAEDILSSVPPDAGGTGASLDATQVARAAAAEIDRYRRFDPDLTVHVDVREGTTGLMVSNGDLLISPAARVPTDRLDSLLHHEIGVHVVTYVNGAHQPLRVLATGLAGHEETQEGLAVLAEHLTGGLTAARLRQLAARVVAVHLMLEDASFPEIHRRLVECGVGSRSAFAITTRVVRSGGFTKDAVYLRGLREVVDHVAAGHPLDPLWLGKMPLSAVPLVRDLHERGVLGDPLLRPLFLDDPAAADRLAALPQVSSLTALIGEPS